MILHPASWGVHCFPATELCFLALLGGIFLSAGRPPTFRRCTGKGPCNTRWLQKGDFFTGCMAGVYRILYFVTTFVLIFEGGKLLC